MKLILSYAELSALVLKQTGKEVEFSHGGYNTLRVSLNLSISFFNASPSVNVVFDKVESNHVFFSLSQVLMGLSKIVDNTIPSILQQFPFIKLDGDCFDVDLSGIEKLKPLLETVDLVGIAFQSDCVELSFKLHK